MDLKTAVKNDIAGKTDCVFLVLKKNDLEDPSVQTFITKEKMAAISESIPEWMDGILKLYGGFDMKNILVVYKKE